MNISLGSLFDGIGAVPYAASFFGIKTLWASEILPNAVSVTKRHFPDMEHLGDITKLDGGKISPVDIITFGSPCQSWSVAAGNRTGFEGKSGLFMEAIRIIREMRKATNGRYPQFALFENVVGLLNCGAGGRSNYQTVLEAFCEAEIPMPKSGRWANAGMVRGRGIDLAWVVKDSQYHRTAQRRKRLFALVDYTGERAGKILFVSKSLSGYFAARESERERIAADAESGVGNASGKNIVYGICSYKSNSMLSGNPHSGIYKAETCRTLDQNCANPSCNQGGMVIVEPQKHTINHDVHPKLAGTLCASGAGLSRPAGMANEADLCVTYCLQGNMIGRQDKNGPQGNGINEEICYTISSSDHHAIATLSRQRSDLFKQEDLASTQTARQYKDATDLVCQNIVSTVDCRNLCENSEISGTLQSKCTGGYSLNYLNPVRTGYIVRRLTPTEAERLMSLPDGWTEYGHDGKLMSDSARYQFCGNSIVVNCLAYIMQNISEHLKCRACDERADNDY